MKIDLIIYLLKKLANLTSTNILFIDEEMSSRINVDTMVTVVDSYNFFKDFGSPETLMDRKLTDI